MISQTLYHTALVAHIIGLTMLAGTTLVDYVITKHFWNQFAADKLKGLTINQATSKYAMLSGIGMILIIISGVLMMGLTHGVFGEQIWFRIKFGLVLIIIINGIVTRRRQGAKLNELLTTRTPEENVHEKLLKVKRNLNLFHLIQITLFISIFTLSVFKFN